MRHGDFTALAAIAIGAAASTALTATLLWGPSIPSVAPSAPDAPRDVESRVQPRESFTHETAFGFRAPIDFAVIRIPTQRMSGPESAATGWHRAGGLAPHAPDQR